MFLILPSDFRVILQRSDTSRETKTPCINPHLRSLKRHSGDPARAIYPLRDDLSCSIENDGILKGKRGKERSYAADGAANDPEQRIIAREKRKSARASAPVVSDLANLAK